MGIMPRHLLLFLIIFIEGYVVLAVELLAMRQLVPFVGSDTIVISIVISAVLLPLAFGYYFGGQFQPGRRMRGRKGKQGRINGVRRKLMRNLFAAILVLSFGLSYLVMEMFFFLLHAGGIYHKVLQTGAYAVLFLSYPVFLLGQTVPLISNYFSNAHLSSITGRMLCFSTAGSFLGSVFSTLVLMSVVGVHNTALITIALLASALFLLSKRTLNSDTLFACIILALAFYLNSPMMISERGIIYSNQYNTVGVIDLPDQDAKLLMTNRSPASKFAPDPKNRFPYLQYIEKQLIDTLPKDRPAKILVLGAGGFTMGWDDRFHQYTFVDIDKDLKEVSERYFLPEPLPDNKVFVPEAARVFINHADKASYDLVVVDFFNNIKSISLEVISVKFWQDLKGLLKPNGILVGNIIEHPAFGDRFTIRFHNTFSAGMPIFTRQVIGDFNPWLTRKTVANVLYIYFNGADSADRTIYTDDKNTYFLDR
jgi:predicted membrane-bound spermidine synthase